MLRFEFALQRSICYAAKAHSRDSAMLDNQPRGTICIEDLEIGMTRHLDKTITDRDIELFA